MRISETIQIVVLDFSQLPWSVGKLIFLLASKNDFLKKFTSFDSKMVQLTHLGRFSGHPVTSNGVNNKMCEPGSVKTHNIKGLENTNDKNGSN